jgi:TonB family protein
MRHPRLSCTLATTLALTTAFAARAQQLPATPQSAADTAAAASAPPKWEPVDPGSPTFALRSTTPQPPVDASKPVPMATGVMRANLVHAVPPVYPLDAKNHHITGVVVLHALVAKDGSIAKVDVVSGPAQLRQAAIDAVQQWKYKPTTLNGTPVQVLTQINLNFTLNNR